MPRSPFHHMGATHSRMGAKSTARLRLTLNRREGNNGVVQGRGAGGAFRSGLVTGSRPGKPLGPMVITVAENVDTATRMVIITVRVVASRCECGKKCGFGCLRIRTGRSRAGRRPPARKISGTGPGSARENASSLLCTNDGRWYTKGCVYEDNCCFCHGLPRWAGDFRSRYAR